MRFSICAATLAALLPAITHAAGLARGDHFSVITPATPNQSAADSYAKLVLQRAEKFRAYFVQEWLSADLPPSDVRTVISVKFSATENSGLTLAKVSESQRFHNVFLSSSAENAAGPMLHHEVVHTVLATAFPHPNRLPPWVEEGIASQFDSERLIAVRQQEVRYWLRSGQFPTLAALFGATDIASIDDTGYAAAESLVAYLLTKGDKPTLIHFAAEARHSGCDAALQSFYNIAGVGELQRDWQAWLAESMK